MELLVLFFLSNESFRERNRQPLPDGKESERRPRGRESNNSNEWHRTREKIEEGKRGALCEQEEREIKKDMERKRERERERQTDW